MARISITWPTSGCLPFPRPAASPRRSCCSCTAGSGAPRTTGSTPGRWPRRWRPTGSPSVRPSSAGSGSLEAAGPARSMTSRPPSTSCRADPSRLLLAGHSAGGHLALWAASRHRLPPGTPWAAPAYPYLGVVALAAVSDLVSGHRQALGQGAVARLLGGGPDEQKERYALTSPAGLLPTGKRVRLIHGRSDEIVPCEMSLDYAARAQAAGDDAACAALPGVGHFEVIDPLSGAWPEVAAAFRGLC